MTIEAHTSYRFGLGRILRDRVDVINPSDEKIPVITSQTPIPEVIIVKSPDEIELRCLTGGNWISGVYRGEELRKMYIEKMPPLIPISKTMIRWKP